MADTEKKLEALEQEAVAERVQILKRMLLRKML